MKKLILLLFTSLTIYGYSCSNMNIHNTITLFSNYNYVEVTSTKLIVYKTKMQEAIKKMNDDTAGATAIAISVYAIEHNLEIEYR